MSDINDVVNLALELFKIRYSSGGVVYESADYVMEDCFDIARLALKELENLKVIHTESKNET